MAFKVQVGPPQIAIHQGQTVLVTDPDGTITRPSEKGLYFLDTRIVSNWAIYANGEPWLTQRESSFTNIARLAGVSALGTYDLRSEIRGVGAVPARQLDRPRGRIPSAHPPQPAVPDRRHEWFPST